MEISELKALARERRIKMYYIKKKAELIQILSLKELPQIYIVEKKTLNDLRVEAKARGLSGFYTFNRQSMAELLYPDICSKSGLKKNDEYDDGAKKHYSPKKHDA